MAKSTRLGFLNDPHPERFLHNDHVMELELVTDHWDGDRNLESITEGASVDAIEKAVESLDGQIRTLVMLNATEPSHMAIGGGGKNGLCVVYASFDGKRFFRATRENAASTPVIVRAGGQDGEYPQRLTVDRGTALRGARTFAESGQLDPSIIWTE
jgi:hypothetical protein